MRAYDLGNDTEDDMPKEKDDLLEQAWVLIANGNNGWDGTNLEWDQAAQRWRERYFAFLDSEKDVRDGNTEVM